MASSRANRTQAQKNKDTDRNTDRMAVLRSNKAYRDKENNREKERKSKQRQEDPEHWERVLACKTKWNKVVTSNVNIIKDVTRGDLNTPLWKRPGIDYHTEDFEQHWQAALHNLYLNSNIGWDIEFRWDLAFIHKYDRMMNEIKKMMAARDRVKELRDQYKRGDTDKWKFVAGSLIGFRDVGSRDEKEETRSELLHILGLSKMTQFENNMKQSESSADRSKHQGELANWLKHSNSSRIPRLQEHLNKRDAENNKRIDVSLPNLHKLCSLHCLALERKVTFVQIATQPFEDKDREAAVQHQSNNAGPPLLLDVLPARHSVSTMK